MALLYSLLGLLCLGLIVWIVVEWIGFSLKRGAKNAADQDKDMNAVLVEAHAEFVMLAMIVLGSLLAGLGFVLALLPLTFVICGASHWLVALGVSLITSYLLPT